MEIDNYEQINITFEYDNEMDFNNLYINFYLRDSIYNWEHHCEINLKKFQNINKSFPLDYEKLVEIFRKLISLNYSEILIKSKMHCLDGSRLKISIFYGGSSIKFSVWCHDLNIKKRGLEEINFIFNELMNICEIKIE